MRGARAAASAAAFVALMAIAATVAYVAARDDDPTPPTSSTTAATRAPTSEELATAVAAGLSEGLEVPLDGIEARCVADGLLEQLGQARLEALADEPSPSLSDDERTGLVRTVVLCVPPEKAAALLSSTSSTTIVVQLPDEGTDL